MFTTYRCKECATDYGVSTFETRTNGVIRCPQCGSVMEDSTDIVRTERNLDEARNDWLEDQEHIWTADMRQRLIEDVEEHMPEELSDMPAGLSLDDKFEWLMDNDGDDILIGEE
jgi:DNA-directed RNA polymerase subunit RPC12/RpoP